jgi:uroporphyrinogen III methyltransferase/synthase
MQTAGKAADAIHPPGNVYLVGAGPGDAGLITARGLRCLQAADVVLYDYLANPRILEACPGAVCICIGRHGKGKVWSQAEINARLIAEAHAGNTVVRLKGGDPGVFARLAEETDALDAAGIRYEVVPGITAAMAVASYCGVPLTHRDVASAVAFVTGQQKQDDEHAAPLDYRALARFPGTLVFYMGVTTARHWSQELISGGMRPDMPVAIVRRCTWPDQMTLRCQLNEVADVLARRHLRPPVLVIVGDVVSRSRGDTWFTERPLFGKRVLVTRPLEQTVSLRESLEQLGAEVLVQPAIEIGPPEDWGRVDSTLSRLDQFDWLVFSSANGVRAVMHRIRDLGGDARWLGRLKLAAIGPGTSAELEKFHLKADLVPHEFRAESLAEELAGQGSGRRFLLARASRGREVLGQRLVAAGGEVEQIVVYQSRDMTQADATILAALAAGEVDWITVTSSAIARSLANLFGAQLRNSRLVSISPITSQTLRELGFEPAAEARQYTMPGIVQAMLASDAVEN